MNLAERREKRKKQTAEDFTPNFLVNEILDKLSEYGPEVWEEGKTFCDPSCGNGQFLIWVLFRKLAKGHEPLAALKTIYGVDIMKDNIRECRLRLLKAISLWEPIQEEHIKAVFKNIVWINSKKYPGGALDYDFSFPNKVKMADVDSWMVNIYCEDILDDVKLPVSGTEFMTKTGYIDLFADSEDDEKE